MELVNFFISNDLTQIVDFPTWTHDCDLHIPVLLDLFISSDNSICSTVVFLPTENFHCVVVFQFPLTSQQTQKRMYLFIAKLMTVLVLIGTIFVRIYVHISLIINIRSSLTHPNGFHLCILIIICSFVHIDNKTKDFLIVGIGPTQGLDDTILASETSYSINFSRSNGKFCVSLHYNGSISFLFVHATKIY